MSQILHFAHHSSSYLFIIRSFPRDHDGIWKTVILNQFLYRLHSPPLKKKLCSYVHYTKPQKYEITLQNCEFRLVISYWEKINIMPCIVWLESFVLASFKELIRENTFALRMARETAHLMHLLETNVYANYNYQRCIIITEGSRIVRHKRPTMRLFFFTSVCKIGSMPGNLHVYVKCVR